MTRSIKRDAFITLLAAGFYSVPRAEGFRLHFKQKARALELAGACLPHIKDPGGISEQRVREILKQAESL